MSPVFGHGRMRLYLLKLLEESPRHGYDIIRVLEDRFLGVYAPSAGTIYPRLTRLEEEGLVTHDREGGRKVYRLTEAGRAELHARMDELADVEHDIESSVRDIAREVKEDVRESVRGIREELKYAAQQTRDEPGQSGDRRDRRENAWENVWENAWQHAHHAQKRAWRDSMRSGMREGMEAAWRSAWEEMQGAWQEQQRASGSPGHAHGRAKEDEAAQAEAKQESPDAHHEAQQEFDALLQGFTDAARESAGRGHLDDDALRACHAILDNTLTTLRATLRT